MKHCRGGTPTKKCLFHFYLANISRDGVGPSVFTLTDWADPPKVYRKLHAQTRQWEYSNSCRFTESFSWIIQYYIFGVSAVLFVSCHHQFLGDKLLKCLAILKYENRYNTRYTRIDRFDVGCPNRRNTNLANKKHLLNVWHKTPLFKYIFRVTTTYLFVLQRRMG